MMIGELVLCVGDERERFPLGASAYAALTAEQTNTETILLARVTSGEPPRETGVRLIEAATRGGRDPWSVRVLVRFRVRFRVRESRGPQNPFVPSRLERQRGSSSRDENAPEVPSLAIGSALHGRRVAPSTAAAYAPSSRSRALPFVPSTMGGMPCIRGMWLPVATVVAMVADGMSFDEILRACPDLEPEGIRESLRFAADAVRERTLPLAPSS